MDNKSNNPIDIKSIPAAETPVAIPVKIVEKKDESKK